MVDAQQSSITDAGKKIANIGLLIIGAVVAIVMLLIYKHNTPMFGMLLAIYMIGYAILVLLYIYTHKRDTTDTYFDIVTYVSFYTITLQLVIFALTVTVFVKSRKTAAIS